MACLNTSIQYATVLRQVYPLRRDTPQGFRNATKKTQPPRTPKNFFKVCICSDETPTFILVFHVSDWPTVSFAEHRCFICVWEIVHDISVYTVAWW